MSEDEMSERIAQLEAELAKTVRLATDRSYMMEAYRQMLMPNGIKVANMWANKKVHRVHHSWGPEAHTMSGEERAAHILDWEDAFLLTGRSVTNVDTPPQPIDETVTEEDTE